MSNSCPNKEPDMITSSEEVKEGIRFSLK